MASKEYIFELPVVRLFEFFKLSKLIYEINVEINESGFYSKSLHQSQDMGVISRLDKEHFTTYDKTIPTKPPIAYTQEVWRMIMWLGKQKGDAKFIVQTEDIDGNVDTPVKIVISIATDTLSKKKTFLLLHPQPFPGDIKTTYISKFQLSSQSVAEIVREVKELGCHSISFNISKDSVIIKDDDSIELDLTKMEGTIIDHKEQEDTSIINMSRSYLCDIFGAGAKKADYTFHYHEGQPMMMEYAIEGSMHKVILAPIIRN